MKCMFTGSENYGPCQGEVIQLSLDTTPCCGGKYDNQFCEVHYNLHRDAWLHSHPGSIHATYAEHRNGVLNITQDKSKPWWEEPFE